MMTWSSILMPRMSAACFRRVVSCRSSLLGVGSPDGWLCYVALRVMWSSCRLTRLRLPKTCESTVSSYT